MPAILLASSAPRGAGFVGVDVTAADREHVDLLVLRLVHARVLEHDRLKERAHLGVERRAGKYMRSRSGDGIAKTLPAVRDDGI